jgi:hypothetical protein
MRSTYVSSLDLIYTSCVAILQAAPRTRILLGLFIQVGTRENIRYLNGSMITNGESGDDHYLA